MKRYCPGLLFVVTLCLALIAGCSGAPQGAPPTSTLLPPTATPLPPTPTPAPPVAAVPDILTSFQDAVNRQDLDGILNLFVDSGLTYSETGFAYVYDKPTLRDYWDGQFGLHVVIAEIRDCTATEDTLRCTLVAHDDCYAVYGIPESRSELYVKLKDGKIEQMITTAVAEDKKHFDDTYPKMIAWAQANLPEDWKIANSRKMSRAVGDAYSRLCSAYAATLK